MSYSKIYGFKKYLTLGIIFLILCLAAITAGIVVLAIQGYSWYLFLVLVIALYTIYSALYLSKMLFWNFRAEVKAEGNFVETQIFYERETNYPYIKVDGNHVPLLGLYPKKLWEKFPEQSKITAYLPKGKKTAILIK